MKKHQTTGEIYLRELQMRYLGKRQKKIQRLSQLNKMSLEVTKKRIEKALEMSKEIPGNFLNDELIKGEIGKFRERMLKLAANATYSEDLNDPLLFRPFKQSLTRVHEMANKMGIGHSFLPTFGTLPIAQPNALALRVPHSDEVIIVFHVGLGGFLNRAVKIILSVHVALPLNEYKKLNRKSTNFIENYRDLVRLTLRDKPSLRQPFFELLHAYFATGNPNQAPPIYVNFYSYLLQGFLLNAVELFVAGHEYAHVICGHLNKKNLQIVSKKIGDTEVSFINHNHIDEIEADSIGYTILSGISGERWLDVYPPLYYMELSMPEVFFCLIDILQKCISIIRKGHGESESDSHPPACERRKILQQIYRKITGNKHNNLYSIEFCIILEELWVQVKSKIFEAFPNESYLSKIWRMV